MAHRHLSILPRSQQAVSTPYRIARLFIVTAMLASGLVVSTVGSMPAGADTSIPVFQTSTQLPSISGSTYTNPNDMSCPSLNNCVIVGDFEDGSGAHGFIMSESNGTWGTPTVVDLAPSGTPVSLSNVSCPTVGNCTAAGTFKDLAFNSYSFALSEQNGVWGSGAPLTPVLSSGPTGLSCWAPGNCTLIGYDITAAIPVVWNQTDYRWDASPAPLPFPTNPSNYYLQSISCPSAGNCTAIGPSSGDYSVAIEEIGGVWNQGTNLTNPSGYASARLSTISCTSPGNCTAVGEASIHPPDGAAVRGTPINSAQGAGITESNGVWGAYSIFPNPAGETISQLNGVSCTSPGNCTAVGITGAQAPVAPTLKSAPYFGGLGIAITESSGTWGSLSTQLPNGLDLYGVVCITSALCVNFGAIGASSVWSSTSVPQLTLSATSPANPTLGLAYSAQFSASGGVAPYSFSISQGSLPPGLSIDPATGTVSGIPISAGTFGFTVTLTDTSNPTQSVSAPVTLVVGAKLAATGADLRSQGLEGLGLLVLGFGLVAITRRRILQVH